MHEVLLHPLPPMPLLHGVEIFQMWLKSDKIINTLNQDPHSSVLSILTIIYKQPAKYLSKLFHCFGTGPTAKTLQHNQICHTIHVF
jgi:hypothetical protein